VRGWWVGGGGGVVGLVQGVEKGVARAEGDEADGGQRGAGGGRRGAVEQVDDAAVAREEDDCLVLSCDWC